MLFTLTPPERQGNLVRLYYSLDEVRAAARDDPQIYLLAVHYDASMHCLITTLGSPSREMDPDWTTPAEDQDDGSILARGPIPGPLFVDRSCSGLHAARD